MAHCRRVGALQPGSRVRGSWGLQTGSLTHNVCRTLAALRGCQRHIIYELKTPLGERRKYYTALSTPLLSRPHFSSRVGILVLAAKNVEDGSILLITAFAISASCFLPKTCAGVPPVVRRELLRIIYLGPQRDKHFLTIRLRVVFMSARISSQHSGWRIQNGSALSTFQHSSRSVLKTQAKPHGATPSRYVPEQETCSHVCIQNRSGHRSRWY